MRLSAPTRLVFWISLVIAILALANQLLAVVGVSIQIPYFTSNAFWFLAVAYALLALGVTLKGL
ncbi:MAG: hypothetical protein LBI57_04790 [Helicobacteraceae bacterium]|jgi:uncharacterized membrane protein|nr:hypothetical protein [Helicobacteraceae bacterium]